MKSARHPKPPKKFTTHAPLLGKLLEGVFHPNKGVIQERERQRSGSREANTKRGRNPREMLGEV